MAAFKEVPANAPFAEKALTWVDNRFPASKLYKEHLGEYYAPKNFNFWYIFGSLALLMKWTWSFPVKVCPFLVSSISMSGR